MKPDPMIARDLIGYGEVLPNPDWPGGAVVAVNFNLNVEGGGEATLANGDEISEGMLNDIGVPTQAGRRVPLVESVFEYGSRRGVWRLLNVFRDFSVKVSVLGVARGLEQTPDLARAFIERGHEVVSHGYRWIDYGEVPEDVERDHIQRAVTILTKLTGTRPIGWMTGRPGPNTRHLLVEAGGFLRTTEICLRMNCLIGCGLMTSRTSSSPTPMRRTITGSMRTTVFLQAMISFPTCGTLSISFTGKAATGHRNCFLLVCMIDL